MIFSAIISAIALIAGTVPSCFAANAEWKDLLNQGASAELTHSYAKAEFKYKKALEAIENAHVSPEARARVLSRLARIYVEQRRFRDADPLVKEAVAIASDSRLQGEHHGELLVELDDLCDSYLDLKKVSELDKLRKVIEICDKPFGGKHRDLLTRFCDLACLLIQDDRFDEAEPLVARSLSMAQNEHKWNNTARVHVLRIAKAYRDQGKEAKAKWLDKQVKALADSDRTRRYPTMPLDAQRAQLLYHSGKNKEAQTLIAKAIAELTKKEGAFSPGLLQLYETQAKILGALHDYENADKVLVKSIKLHQDLKMDEWVIADILKQRAHFYRESGRKKEARKLEEQAKQMRFTFYFGSKARQN